MQILLLGGTGQVGWELLRLLRSNYQVVAPERAELDLLDLHALDSYLLRSRPQFILNAAALTDVDQAEREPHLADLLNTRVPAVLAASAERTGATLVHFSTDYVFDGMSSIPYIESDACNPLNTYGRSKLAAENAIQKAGCRYIILRTSRVFSLRRQNFVLKVIQRAHGDGKLNVVNEGDIGMPTSARALAYAAERILARVALEPDLTGMFHCSCAGTTSWYEFARTILSEAGISASLEPVDAVPTATKRPLKTWLDCGLLERTFEIEMPTWQMELRDMLRG